MAEAPSYTTVPGKLPLLLTKIREVGVPTKATNAWLESLGFKSKNDRSMLAVLRQIGFIDANSVPTPAWREYRGGDHRAVLGRALRLGYEDLYTTYPDAHERSNMDISHFFSTRTNAGKQSVDKMVSSFKSLVGLAEFKLTTEAPPALDVPNSTIGIDAEPGTVVARTTPTPSGLSVNINIQLTLPESTDGKVYEAFFKAMRAHLLSDDQ